MTISTNHPSRNECLEMLKEYGTPPHVVGHCKSVAAVACRLGEALNAAGGTKAAPVSEITVKKCRRPDDVVRTY